ncbi:acetyl-CoA carboxylase biotin carboxyl carrier protein [Pseudalkalibacillus berkeleyi]|uniref:Biotin carboxyl carrier protein of acetyl-CoA carboxylase n=1 Tax=Pseudalkalibacillus berkeleyi TaxID=1069813 RepID=A0ABS9GYN8_9BACL|nr:acetyl-CoA carboxylase biotin carboxyl carrier protein [Pseudalkalibacillus berkeleyi]MCF6137854.1 acetyl-CoA carboxylase biotin carboxyl carrier protein [Pseudalkalibacillus berkeleyi]
MLKIQEIRELIKLIDQSSINEFNYELEDAKITLKKGGGEQVVQQTVQPRVEQAAPAPQVQAQPSQPSESKQEANSGNSEPVKEMDETLHKIESPMVGTFYASPSPDEDVYVNTGDKVSNDSIVCIIEAMKLFNEIEAEVNGEIVEVLVENGQLVEYGQPLFLVKKQ